MTATEIADQAFRAFALVVVVGPSFLPLPDDDPVRALVAAAATHRTPLVVVLVDGAARPAAADLPDDLEALSEADAVPLTIDGFESQVPELTLRLDQLVRARRPPDDRT
ncbi:MAG: hypothetical protein S0880_03885 [Actinomycetota bacterium]|nr:hypothetical protein [Actinomycetota bacterium]